ncbi:MAG: hypothetical protein DRP09_04540 [Candidatus Thorarchaeota archaeon]|nr:MAG: hypothetical protein DRP09_04540 [Candidatus Thorarchaeota archaeon]
MSSYTKWATVAVGVVCAVIALLSATLYPVNTWGILEVIAYEGVLLLLIYGILRLVYARGLVR